MPSPTAANETRPLLIDPATAARLLGVSRSKVYTMISRGAIPGCMRVGSSVRISRAVLERWIADQTDATA